MTETRDDRIRARAYDLWQSDGGKAGDDWAYWLRAEREISEEDAAAVVGSAPANQGEGAVAVPAKEPIKKASPKKPPTAKTTPAKSAPPKPTPAKPAAAKPAAAKAQKQDKAAAAVKGKPKATSAAPAPGKR